MFRRTRLNVRLYVHCVLYCDLMLPVTVRANTEMYRTALLSLYYLSVSKLTLHNTYQAKSYTFKSWNLYGKAVLERPKPRPTSVI